MNFPYCAVWGILILTLLLPFLGLFGFFENRQKGCSTFRSNRFLITVFALLALNIASGFFSLFVVENLVSGAVTAAEKAVLRNRTSTEYSLNNLGVMFPEVLNDRTKACYRSALSNYVEDQWRKSLHETSCKSENHVCADSEQVLYEGLLKTWGPKQSVALSLRAIGSTLSSIWTTASGVYKLERRLLRMPDKDGNMPEQTDERMLADYNSYLTNCLSLKATSWANPKDDLLLSRGSLCWGDCL